MNRRDFLASGAGTLINLRRESVLATGAVFSVTNQAKKSKRIRILSLGEAVRVRNCSGDVWSATWADDDNLYAVSDDTSGFSHTCNSNLALNQISGEMPPDIHGRTVNCMKEFGAASETRSEDGAMWKACGLICVDGVLYMSVSRHLTCATQPNGAWQGRSSPFWIQETWDASIIKSADHGKTWSAAPQLNHAMFPGRTFSTPFFVQHGKDGADAPKRCGDYVYAVSNDGAWNNGNWMVLGRVRRDRIGYLDAGDWEFVHGFDNRGNPLWRSRYDNALYIFWAPGRTSMTGIHYIAPWDIYVLPQWYYPYLRDKNRRWKVTQWEFYQAPAPWGPWTLFFSQEFQTQSWYNPCIPSKFISDDGRRFWIFTAGDFTGNGQYYGLNMIPADISNG
jgi:hypothetical protein